MVTKQPAVVIAAIDAKFEIVTIANRGEAPQNMSGWRLVSGPEDKQQISYAFPAGFVLEAGKSVRLHSFKGTDSADDLYWGRGSLNAGRNIWGKKGDVGTLFDGNGWLVSRFVY